MECAMNRRWFEANILHNVDLSACRPSGRIKVATKHPKCRPDPLPLRYLDTSFEPAIFLLKMTGGFEPRGCVVSCNPIRSLITFLPGCDDELTPLNVQIG